MEKVDEKFSKLNGLCDHKTAAIIVANEMKINETVMIKDMIHDIEPIEEACEISCQYSGTRTCGQCLHGSLYTPIEEICESCKHFRKFICKECHSASRYSQKESEIAQEREKRLLDTLKFGPASQSERIVFGARRPGSSINEVNEWVAS